VAFRRYVSADEDSGRWHNFPFRTGDVVISTRSKHGTTWMQMIVLLLIHQRTELPAPLVQLSPWLDHLVEPRNAVVGRLEAQCHRRVIKTHTPLDGVPMDPRAFYIVVARHPLDAAVSLYHQGDNIDRERMRHLVGGTTPTTHAGPRPSASEWLAAWIDAHADPDLALDSLPGVMWHLSDAWSRRAARNVVLVHFDDLLANLDGQMRRLAGTLDIEPPRAAWDRLVEAATIDAMRDRAEQLAPDAVGILLDQRSFFRSGVSGAGAALLQPAELMRYHKRTAALAPADLLAWLHR
jgi:hypothetical protein